MIVDPDFPDHWKTKLLIDTLEDPAAPMAVIRLWAHCQNRRTHYFPNLSSAAVKAICHYEGDPGKLETALISSGFIVRTGADVTVHEWEEYNASLIANWSNGKKGGRPRKPKTNPNETHGIPMANPSETHGVTHQEPIDRIGLDSPPSPPETEVAPPADPWEAAEAELIEAGVGSAAVVCSKARASKCSPELVRSVLEFWRSKKPAWDCGALFRRLETLRPGQDPGKSELWPPVSKQADVAKSRDRSLEKQADLEAQKQKETEKKASEKAKMDRLEQRYGSYIDELTPKEIRAMTINVCGNSASMLLRSWGSTGHPRGIHRESLLLELARSNFQVSREAVR